MTWQTVYQLIYRGFHTWLTWRSPGGRPAGGACSVSNEKRPENLGAVVREQARCEPEVCGTGSFLHGMSRALGAEHCFGTGGGCFRGLGAAWAKIYFKYRRQGT
jgi:hypothetical protein